MKKNIRKLRTMRYFIDAAQSITEQEGLEGLTIRKVADLAGYNSATLYSYFENLEHLTFYASLKYLRTYLLRLQDLKQPHDGFRRFIEIWHAFAYEAFTYPDHYYNIFYAPKHFKFNDTVRMYYEIFPEDLENLSDDLLPMLLETNIYVRDYEALKRCADQGYFQVEQIPEINDILILLFESYLLRVRSKTSDLTVEEHVNVIIRYFSAVIKGYICKFRNSPAKAVE